MKAVLVKAPGGADQLFLGDAPVPSINPNEILVRVKATSLNRMDIIQREGRYPVPKDASAILGVDMAGVVESVGPNVTKYKTGDAVFGLLQGGGYAEYVAVPEDLVLAKPESLSFEQAAAIPEVFMTAYQTLFLVGEAKAGETVLIHAGASGVGSAAIQLCREHGIESFVTAGSQEKIDYCKSLGAKEGFNYKEDDFAQRLADLTNRSGVDVILDFVGAPYFKQNIASLAKSGRLVIVGYMGGAIADHVDLRLMLGKWLTVRGTSLRARSHEYRVNLAKQMWQFCESRFADGRLQVNIDSTFDWNDVQKAHRHMESNANKGKIVLKIA